ncbi:MAG: RNA polymerase sigma factor [Nannocystaceae bacterium]|nr:sigma-70 family RNA polymerase sigma factor [bacterium]
MTELDRIVRDYSAMVQGALRQLGVELSQLEDASQEVFLVLARRFAEYDTRRSLSSWLWGIARGVASTQRRSSRRRTRLCTAFAAQPALDVATPDELVARAQARDMLRAFLDSLDEDKCAVFVLSEIEGCSGPEIAARLGANLNTVYARLRAARRRFDDVVEQRRRGVAAASAWWGLRWSMPKAATASLSTVLAAAVVVPSIERAHEAPPVVVANVTLGEPEITSARKAPGPAKVQVERNTSPMPKTLPTVALAAALTVPALAQARPSSKAPSKTDQDADEAALVSDLETREYIFDGDDIDGDIHGPSGENITSRVSAHHESLIRIRGHFISELITLATDI